MTNETLYISILIGAMDNKLGRVGGSWSGLLDHGLEFVPFKSSDLLPDWVTNKECYVISFIVIMAIKRGNVLSLHQIGYMTYLICHYITIYSFLFKLPLMLRISYLHIYIRISAKNKARPEYSDFCETAAKLLLNCYLIVTKLSRAIYIWQILPNVFWVFYCCQFGVKALLIVRNGIWHS